MTSYTMILNFGVKPFVQVSTEMGVNTLKIFQGYVKLAWISIQN